MVRRQKSRSIPHRNSKQLAPLHHQLYVELRRGLVDGAANPAQPLPSEAELSRRFGVSRVTVRRALARLEDEQLIRRAQGVGSFATAKVRAPARTNISGLIDNLITLEESTTARNLAWSTVRTPAELISALGETSALRVLRVRSYRGQPVSLTTIHVANAYARHLKRAEIGQEPIAKALDRIGVPLLTADQVLTAVPAGKLAQRHLGVALNSPLICMRRLVYAQDQTPVLHQESLYAPSRFEYRMTLTRTSLGPVAKWTPIA